TRRPARRRPWAPARPARASLRRPAISASRARGRPASRTGFPPSSRRAAPALDDALRPQFLELCEDGVGAFDAPEQAKELLERPRMEVSPVLGNRILDDQGVVAAVGGI